MRGTLRLILRDLRQATRNVAGSMMLFGLVLIPLLFTWFNVLASWEPFDNTDQLKVAVASEDEGYTSDLLPLPLNVGDQVLNELRGNDQMDWVVTNSEEAVEGAKSGEYYAAIVLPPSFSDDLLTFYSDGATPAEIVYYANEKKNALSPKITGAGAEGVSASISETFTRTVGDVSLEFVTSLSNYLNQGDTQEALQRIQARADGIERQLSMGARTARSMVGLVDSTIPLVESAQKIAGSASIDLPPLETTQFTAPSDALRESLGATAESYSVVRDRINAVYDDASATHGERAAALNTLAAQVQGTIDGYKDLRARVAALPLPAESATLLGRLDEAIAAQEAVHERLVAAASAPLPERPDLSGIDRAKEAIANAQGVGLSSSLNQLSESLSQVGGDVADAKTTVTLDSSGLQDTKQALQDLATGLQDKATSFHDLRKDIDKAVETGDITMLADLIGTHPDAVANSIAAPVNVDRQEVFPVGSFGAGMTPLYTALALWVGSLLCVVAVRPDVVNGEDYGRIQRYFGRYGFLAIIGLAQSTLLMLGLILFVQVDPAHPLLMLLAGWTTSLVYMFINYTLLIALANAGKAVAVLLLVIQISSAGGAYPLQLLPEWFQNISPWMPATYTIRALRAAIAGTYHGDFWIALLCLLAFAAPMAFIGVVFNKPLEKFTQGWVHTLEKTKLM
ncbi:YhgE/Pip domain-containing protein [Corynebacterium sp.]|uniref:YhgE/Pip domain-containing protein n=1 Tax=Corynebacterium sp. TaxID=1720 RepID=UPI0026DD1E09|nr:YhgE/Pip domain-containing protein [Corynebacterium sp.]MDO5032549.1 YhgE/Pip domain-containing protein [Corynebacterium sp.]